MRYYFIYKKYKYVNLLMFDYNKSVQLYKNSKQINNYVYEYNKDFNSTYELAIGQVDLELNEIKRTNGNIYVKFDQENVNKKMNFFQDITII